ncbi:MAG: hypothetical protein H0T47_03245 [Planctomycetaceae bacterium]|nr:hypothetical protein [Planctomycetaceae bacterium]
MTTRQRILRMLLIVGLVPAIAAAGLPLESCQCISSATDAGNCGCGDETSSCCGEGTCHCCEARKTSDSDSKSASCCTGHDELAACKEQSAKLPSVGCRCGHDSVPQPAVPSSPSIEIASPLDLSTSLAVVVPAPPIVAGSYSRTLVTRLPSADLPTTLCTLLI